MKNPPGNEALAKAIAEYPTLRAFSDALGVPYQVVQQWRRNGVPAEQCPEIEKLMGGRVRSESLNSRVNWAYIRANPIPPSEAEATKSE